MKSISTKSTCPVCRSNRRYSSKGYTLVPDDHVIPLHWYCSKKCLITRLSKLTPRERHNLIH